MGRVARARRGRHRRGAAVLVHAFARFVREGIGTPAPVAPTQQLVVGGLYRWVRNPMYIAVVSCVLGQAGIFGASALLVYGAVLMVVFFSFVRLVRGADAAAAVRRGVRGVPAGGAGLVPASTAGTSPASDELTNSWSPGCKLQVGLDRLGP